MVEVLDDHLVGILRHGLSPGLVIPLLILLLYVLFCFFFQLSYISINYFQTSNLLFIRNGSRVEEGESRFVEGFDDRERNIQNQILF